MCKADAALRRHRPQRGKEALRQRGFVRADGVHARFGQKTERGVQAREAGQIHGARFEAIGQEVRHEFRVAHAAGAACNQRRELRGKLRPEHEAAGALRAVEALVAGEGKGADVHGLHIDGKNARRLRAVHEEKQAVPPAKLTHLRDGQERPADVAGVRHDDGPCAWPEQRLRRLCNQRSVCAAGNAAEANALRLELTQRAHDGVVLHGGDQNMVAGAEQPLEQNVQALRDIFRKNDAATVLAAEKRADAFARLENHFLGAVGGAVAAAGNVAAAAGDVAEHRLRHAGGLREGRAGVVEIDRIQDGRLL